MAIGFVLNKAKILPNGAGKVMAKLETWIFCPALSFSTMARFCTVDSIGKHAVNILLSSCGVAIAMGIAIPLACVFIKKKCTNKTHWNI